MVKEAKSEMKDVRSSLESQEHGIDGSAVDRTYNDTDRVVYHSSQ